MHSLLRVSLAALGLSLIAVNARAGEAGYIDLGKFTPTAGCQYVEVNLHSPLLKFASAIVEKDDHEAAALLRSLKHVRVNVVGFNDDTKGGVTDRIGGIRHELEAQGWAKVVTVQQNGRDEDVGVYVKSNDDGSIDGLVVTVMDPNEKQAVFVNVVGNIKPEQIAALGKGLHIEPLSALKMTPPAKNS